MSKSGIHIKPENKGKFTATKKRTGKTTEELTHSKNPLTRKRAIFAQNAAKWHMCGGVVNKHDFGGVVSGLGDLTTSASILAGPAAPVVALAGGAIKAIGAVASAVKQKKEDEKMMKEQKRLKNEMALLSAPMAKEGTWNNPLQVQMRRFGGYKRTTALQNSKNPSFNEMDLRTIDSGGSHEQNPNGGVAIGVGENGKMNTIQEGETIIKDPRNKKDFVLSNEKNMLIGKIPGLPGTIKGDTPAALSKAVKRMFKERPGDRKTEEHFYSLIIDANQQALDRINQENANKQKQNQFPLGGYPISPSILSSLQQYGTGALKNQEPEFLPGNEEIEGSTEDSQSLVNKKPRFLSEDWFKNNEEKIDTGLMIGGLGTQTAGLISSIIQKRGLQKSPDITAMYQDPSIFKENLVNRQNIIRGVENAQSTATHALKQTSSGDFGQFASNVAAVSSGAARSISEAMLNADQLDAAEKARVQQGRAMITESNVRSKYATDVANLENQAAFDAQKTAYSNAITQNIGNMGQSMMNYVMAKKFGKYKEQAGMFSAMSNREGNG